MVHRSLFPASRSFLFAAAVGGLVALAQPRTAGACSPMPSIPYVVLAPRALQPSAPLSVPKSAGLLFQAQLNTKSEAEAKAMATIEVRSGDTIIPGTLESVGRVVNSFAWWRWLPEGETELPTGELEIKISVASDTREDTVTVEEREVSPIAPTFTVSATRQLESDRSAAKISCKDDRAPGSCSGGPREVSTRAIATADVSVALSGNERDKPYFQPTVHIYSRRGGSTDATRETVGWGTLHGQFEGELDEFCAEVTTLSLIDATETKTDVKCIPNTLDLGPVAADEESAFVKKRLGSCATAEYPPGTNADNPTGRGEATAEADASGTNAGESGCSAGAKAPQSNALLAAFTFCVGLLAKRYSRRAAKSRGA